MYTVLFCWFFKFYLFIFRERGGREKERERNINVWEKDQLVASCTPPTGDLAHNPGMCPDWELNQWPFGLQANTQSTQPYQSGLKEIYFFNGYNNPLYKAHKTEGAH